MVMAKWTIQHLVATTMAMDLPQATMMALDLVQVEALLHYQGRRLLALPVDKILVLPI